MNISSVKSKIKGNPHITEGTAYSILVIISISHFLNDMIQSVVPSIYPMLKDEFALSFAQIGLITLVFQMTSSILQPFTGLYADRHPRPYSLSVGMCFTLFGDRFGRKYVIWGSILGAAPFSLALPYVGLWLTVLFAFLSGLIIASAFSSIVVYATDLMPDKVGLVAGIFFGLMFGLGGLGSAFFGWLADRTSVEFIFRVSAFLPLLGVIAGFLPDVQKKAMGK